jgi:hypothetical protein
MCLRHSRFLFPRVPPNGAKNVLSSSPSHIDDDLPDAYLPEAYMANVQRTLAMTTDDDGKLAVLQALALEAQGHVAAGRMAAGVARDTLIAAADAVGLVARHRRDTIRHVVAMGLMGQQALTERSTSPGGAVTAAATPGGRNASYDMELEVRRMSEIASRNIEWLWPNRIAIGKQTLIGGDPGLGKSQLTAALAAAVSTGGEWPCGEGRAVRGNVVILSAEDDAADTIRPRLDAAGADVSRVYQVAAVQQRDGKGRRVFNLQADLPLLEATITRIGDVRLVIIDPISSYMGKTDSHKNADVRATLHPVGDMAERLRVAVVSITHFSKGAGQSAITSFIGSIGFIATSRGGYIVTRDPESDDPARRLFVQAKNNLGPDKHGLSFRIEQRLLDGDILASAIAWNDEQIGKSADDILRAASAARAGDAGGPASPSRDQAEDFLRDLLASGPLAVKDIEAEAKNAGLSWRTLRRARQKLGVRAERRAEAGDGLAGAGRWYWTLTSEVDLPKGANAP